MALATELDVLEADQEVIIAGYGQDIAKQSGELKHFETIVLTDEFLDRGLVIIDNDNEGYACYGDSGGTSYIVEDGEAILVGVNSNIGPKFQEVFCKTEFLISAYVPHHLVWIEAQPKKYEEVMSGK